MMLRLPTLDTSKTGEGLQILERPDKEERFLKVTEVHESDFKRRSVLGLTTSVLAEAVDFVLRIGSMSILARLLIPEYFGLITMVMVVTAVAERVKDLGLTTATIQQKTITHEEVSALFWINAAGGLALAVIVAACAYPLSWFYGDPRLIPITVALATTFVWSSLAVQHQALLNRQMKYTRLAIIQVTTNILSLAIAIVLAVWGAGYWALVAREGLKSVFHAIGAWLMMPWVPGRPSLKTKVTSMLSFGGDLTAFNLVYFVSSNLDKILIGRVLGAAALGVYRQGSQLARMPVAQLVYPVNNVAQSLLSRLQGDPEKYRRSYAKLVTALCAVMMPLMLFLAVFAEETVLVAFGEEWLGGASILRILALASFIDPVAATSGSVMLTCGKSRRFLLLGIASSLTVASCFFVGIHWGAEGIAYASLASSYLFVTPFLWWSFKDTPISLRLVAAAAARPFFASLLMAGVLYNFKVSTIFNAALPTLLVGSALALPLYFSFWFLLPGGRAAMMAVWVD